MCLNMKRSLERHSGRPKQRRVLEDPDGDEVMMGDIRVNDDVEPRCADRIALLHVHVRDRRTSLCCRATTKCTTSRVKELARDISSPTNVGHV